MPGSPPSESEESYSKQGRKKHLKQGSSSDFYREYKKKHKSHRRRSKDTHNNPKKRKIKNESKNHLRMKFEKGKYTSSYLKTEPREESSKNGNGALEPSGSKEHVRVDDQRNSGNSRSHQDRDESSNVEKTVRTKADVQKPNFCLSGKLAEETNIFNGVIIKYSEPPEARMPKKRWRLYPFKGDQGLPTLYIHRQSAYLLGRDRKVADIPIDHPSCSKQHAALQYRLVSYKRVDGTIGKQIRLYIIDLESANGTYINNNKIEPKKYVELFEKDVLKFGFSSREYVLLHEHSKDNDESENES